MIRLYAHPPVNSDWPAVLRIGTGLLLLLDFMALWPDYRLLYGPDGLADPVLLRWDGQTWPVFPFALTESPALFMCYAGLCVWLITGWYARPAAAALLALHVQVFMGAPVFTYGADHISISLLFYMLLAPAGHSAGMLRILQLHVCLLYFFSGLSKLAGPAWWSGEAVWQAVNQPGLTGILPVGLPPFPAAQVWWQCAGWLVIGIELGYPLVCRRPRWRPYGLLAVLSLHAGIALVMGLYYFAAVMSLMNLAAFYFPYLTAKQLTRIFPWLNPLARPAAAGGTPGRSRTG